MDKQPNFAERCNKMKQVASILKDCAEAVMLEAQHMEAAQVRFKERVDKKMSARANRER